MFYLSQTYSLITPNLISTESKGFTDNLQITLLVSVAAKTPYSILNFPEQ